MEFIADTIKGLIRFALYGAVILVIEQYAACHTQIPYLDLTIVPGWICDAPVEFDIDSPQVTDYKPMIISTIHTSAHLVTADKSVENLVFVVPNDERKKWEALTKNNKTLLENLKSSIVNADVFIKNLLSGREITLRVSGKVYGSVDLESINANDISEEKSGSNIIYTVNAPASEILTVDVAPESIEVIGDDQKVMIGLIATMFKEDDVFKTETIKLSKQKILNKVCDNDFMKTTADKAKSTLEKLLSGVAGENKVIVDVPAGTCLLP